MSRALSTFVTGEPLPLGQINARQRVGKFGRHPINLTDEQWKQVIQLLTEGGTYQEAAKMLEINQPVLEANLRVNPAWARECHNARKAAQRATWSVESIEKILAEVASGTPVTTAVSNAGRHPSTFMQVVLDDEVLSEQLMHAKRVAARMAMEEVVTISDDDKNDIDLTGRGNVASVNRAKLRVETRLRLAQAYDPRTFQPNKTEVNVAVQVNHAATLEEARSRRDKRVATVIPSSAREISGPSLPPPAAPAPEVSTQFVEPEAGARPSWDDI